MGDFVVGRALRTPLALLAGLTVLPMLFLVWGDRLEVGQLADAT